MVFLHGFNIHSNLASPIIILHSHSEQQLGCLSAQIHFLSLTNTNICTGTRKPAACQEWNRTSVSLFKRAARPLLWKQESVHRYWCLLSVACLSVASCIKLILIWGLASPQGPIERAKLIPTKQVHLDKWKGNDTSGTRPSSFLLAIYFSGFRFLLGWGWASLWWVLHAMMLLLVKKKTSHFPKAWLSGHQMDWNSTHSGWHNQYMMYRTGIPSSLMGLTHVKAHPPLSSGLFYFQLHVHKWWTDARKDIFFLDFTPLRQETDFSQHMLVQTDVYERRSNKRKWNEINK